MKSKPEPEFEPDPQQLPLTTLPSLKYQQHYSGALTPLHTAASVPFSWEQEPGKPLPCLTLTLQNSHQNIMKCLGLPPRLLNDTKTSSPTTVLEGPYNNNTLGRSVLGSTSFRFLMKKRKSSFDGDICFSGSLGSSPEKGVVVNEKIDKGVFGSWRKNTGVNNYKGKNEVLTSFSDDGDAIGKVGNVSDKKNQLSLSQPKSHFWAKIYGALKQVIPRRSTKYKKDVL